MNHFYTERRLQLLEELNALVPGLKTGMDLDEAHQLIITEIKRLKALAGEKLP